MWRLLLQDSLTDSISLIERAGIVGLLLVIIVGGAKRWWVFGWVYRELEQDRDLYRDLALKGTAAAERSAGAAEKLADQSVQDLAKTIEEAKRKGLI